MDDGVAGRAKRDEPGRRLAAASAVMNSVLIPAALTGVAVEGEDGPRWRPSSGANARPARSSGGTSGNAGSAPHRQNRLGWRGNRAGNSIAEEKKGKRVARSFAQRWSAESVASGFSVSAIIGVFTAIRSAATFSICLQISERGHETLDEMLGLMTP